MNRTDKRLVVAVIGGGFSGAFCAAELAAKTSAPVEIIVIEPRPKLGAGVAYSATDPAHRLNTPAVKMSPYPDRPAHFEDWLRQSGALAEDPATGAPDGHNYPNRDIFGRYMAELVARHAQARPGVTIEHRRDRAIAAERIAGGFLIRGASGATQQADFLVLAVSHPAPSAPKLLAALGEPGIIANPWVPGALAGIPADHDVLIVGTGLTMADTVATLARQHHRGQVTAFSRRGQLSRGHAFTTTAFTWFADNDLPRTALALSQTIRRLIVQAERQNLPWQAVLDDVRANAKPIWDALNLTERRRLLRHLRTFWDSHRYRVAPQIERAVHEKRADGSLRVLAAALRAAERIDGRIRVTLHPRHRPAETLLQVTVDTVVVTTGPSHGDVVATNPVLASLAAQSALRADELGLGIKVDAHSRAIRPDGTPDPALFVAGPLAREYFGELMGLPQVAAQPSAVADGLAALLRTEAAMVAAK
jgi:uncharacterized NAD(P)/FAD-binding protein YdhS